MRGRRRVERAWISRVDVWLTAVNFLYVAGTHEVPAGLSVQSTEHSFHDKSLAPECIWGEWIYTGIIDPPHASLPPCPVSTLSSPWRIRACPSRLPCVPFPFIPSLTPPLAPYNGRPALSVSASLYLPPSAAIAFTTISFYIVTFSACETIRVVRTPSGRSPLIETQRAGGREGRLERKKRK